MFFKSNSQFQDRRLLASIGPDYNIHDRDWIDIDVSEAVRNLQQDQVWNSHGLLYENAAFSDDLASDDARRNDSFPFAFTFFIFPTVFANS